MKIKSDEISRQIIREQIQKGLAQKGSTFDEVLKKTQETIDSVKTTNTAAHSVSSTASVHPLQGVTPLTQETAPVLEQVERLLDVLEEYQQRLGSPNITPDALQTIVTTMEEQNRGLAAILVDLPDGDNLKELLNRVLVASVVEVEKFKRGDYS
jgi:hypothetical protein